MQLDRLGYAGKGRCAGVAVDEGGAVKQEPGGQHPEHEIFQPGLGRAQMIAMERGDNIEREALKFERQIQRDQVIRRNGQHHARSREQDEDRVLEPQNAFAPHVVERQDDREGRARERQDFHEPRETVIHECAVKKLLGRGGMARDQDAPSKGGRRSKPR